MMDRGPYEFPQAEQGESGANLSTRMTFTLIWGSLAASYKQQATSHVVSTDNSIHIQQQKLSNTETVPMMMTLISKGLHGDSGRGGGETEQPGSPTPSTLLQGAPGLPLDQLSVTSLASAPEGEGILW